MQDLCVTATRDHNVYASFRPSIATKHAETRSKMNTAKARRKTVLKVRCFNEAFLRGSNAQIARLCRATAGPLAA